MSFITAYCQIFHSNNLNVHWAAIKYIVDTSLATLRSGSYFIKSSFNKRCCGFF